MAGESSTEEKTEAPTSKRLQEAAKKGQTWQSKELTGTISLLVAVIIFLLFTAKLVLLNFANQFTAVLTQFNQPALAALPIGFGMLVDLLKISAPIVLVPMLVALILIRIQTGNIFSLEPMTIKFEHLNPVSNIKKIVSMQSLVMLGLSLAKVALIAIGLWITIRSSGHDLLRLIYVNPAAAIEVTLAAFQGFVFWVFVALVLFAVFDTIFQKHNFMKQMKMSKSEVKREHKQEEGDPLQKNARKQSAKEDGPRANLQHLAKATHIFKSSDGRFLSLYYNPAYNPMPIAINKVRGTIAEEASRMAYSLGKTIQTADELVEKLWRGSEEAVFMPAAVANIFKDYIKQNQVKRR